MRVAISAAILTVFILGPGLSTADTDRFVKRQSRKINCQTLVIGNAKYSDSPLTNPGNDASDMASALRRLGFNVIVKINADHRQMDTAIREFGKILPRSGIGLFYFADHGMQIKGKNYLIPINNNIHDETDVKCEALDAERILARMEGAGTAMNIVILDVCRVTPRLMSSRQYMCHGMMPGPLFHG
ncbi:caspase family protein [Desulfobacter vibrioformis]|uniref:caspase family protein n=1 Tax=Desulfobacter vibrioformis TaxID=34031 RepID=UPI0006905FD7|nr:caspase family protein [Desulfobacter vibrioformis]